MRFQPQRRLEVEIIGRLVKQQQVGLGEQRRRECNPHAPAAGEFGTGALLIGVGKAQAGEDFRRARGGRMRSDVGEPALDFGDACGLALRVRFGQELGAFNIGLKHDLEQALGAIGRFLGKPADAIARRDSHMPLLGRELAGNDAKERGLAGAVATDKPDMRAGGQCHGGAVKQRAAADPIGEVGDHKHGVFSTKVAVSATCRPGRFLDRHGKAT